MKILFFADIHGDREAIKKLVKKAKYEKIIDLNLEEIIPLTSVPHSPGNIEKVRHQ